MTKCQSPKHSQPRPLRAGVVLRRFGSPPGIRAPHSCTFVGAAHSFPLGQEREAPCQPPLGAPAPIYLGMRRADGMW